MPNNYFDIPHLNAVKFYYDGAAPSGYNYTHIDDDWFFNRQRPWHYKKKYQQKWQYGDAVKFLVTSTFGPVVLKVYTCSGVLLDTVQFIDDGQVSGQPYNIWYLAYAVNSTNFPDDAYYYFVLEVGNSPFKQRVISEPQHIKESHENTILFEYDNSSDVQDFYFGSVSNSMTFRCEGTVDDYRPGGVNTMFIDQEQRPRQIKRTPFRVFSLFLGEVPDWVTDKVDRIMGMETSIIDGIYFTRADGAEFKPTNKTDGVFMCYWEMEIRESSNRMSKRFVGPADEGQPPFMLTYNLDTTLFGPFNGPAQAQQFQITEIENQ